MQDWNKKNLILFGIIALCSLTVFFGVILLDYAKDGIWAAPLPVAAIAYGIYSFLKKYLPLTK